MYQPHWTDVALPLLRLLQQELHISITATRALPVFQKDAFALLSKSFWVLTGKISVGKYVRNFHRCEGLSPRWTQKWGEKWAPATFLSFSLPSKNDVWFHLRKSEVKSTSARHKSPRGALNLESHVMLLFGRRPRNGIHGLVLKKGNDDFRTKLKVRSCPQRWGGCCVVNLGVNH